MSAAASWQERVVLMDAARLERTLTRIAHEILERHPEPGQLLLVGIRRRGVPLARRLAARMQQACGRAPAVGALDITLYRDDFTTIAPHPLTRGTEIPVSIDSRVVIVVDDVLYTGRTVRAALDELVDFGRPARIELAVLVDRGHRELPIRADYVGETVTTAPEESVQVRLSEQDGDDSVVVLAPRAPKPSVSHASPAKADAAQGPVGKLEGTRVAPSRSTKSRKSATSRPSSTPPARRRKR